MKKIRKIMIILILTILIVINNCYVIALIEEPSIKVGSLSSNQSNFFVRFSGEPQVSNKDKVKAYISTDLAATINVTGLTMNENIETATFIVQNTSTDLFANLELEMINSNEEFFKVNVDIDKNVLTNGEATKITVKIELIKTPIKETEKTIIGIKLNAIPVQPTKENVSITDNNQSTIINTNKYDYNEKDDTPKTGNGKFINIFWR